MVNMRGPMSAKKFFAIMALTALIEGGALSTTESFIKNGVSTGGGLEAESLQYVTYVLGKYRTGLGIKEEERLAKVILGEAEAYDIDPVFVLAIIKTESAFYNWSRSVKGAVGLMQILPRTGKMVAEDLGLKWDGEGTLFNPYMNVKLGIHYFSYLRARHGNDTKKTLAAYNIGPISGDEYVPQAFANRVLANYRELKEREGYLN